MRRKEAVHKTDPMGDEDDVVLDGSYWQDETGGAFRWERADMACHEVGGYF